jgi:Domain of unknown function (DUF4440)
MKNILLTLCIPVILLACSTPKPAFIPSAYPAGSKELYDTIAALDSALFHAYNNCELEKYAAFFSEDLEFYHDKGGLDTNKASSVDGVRKYVCGKVTRHLLKGSIEVSPVPNYGAVEIGVHRFTNNQEPNAPGRYARFMIIWKREPKAWVVTRVISLH